MREKDYHTWRNKSEACWYLIFETISTLNLYSMCWRHSMESSGNFKWCFTWIFLACLHLELLHDFAMTSWVGFYCLEDFINTQRDTLHGARHELDPIVCPGVLSSLLKVCRSFNPQDWPTFPQICTVLNYIVFVLLLSFGMQGIVFVAIYMDLNPTSTSAVLMALDQMMFPNFAPHLR